MYIADYGAISQALLKPDVITKFHNKYTQGCYDIFEKIIGDFVAKHIPLHKRLAKKAKKTL